MVGENVPFVTGSLSTNGGVANPYTTIERKDVGVTLKVVPRILVKAEHYAWKLNKKCQMSKPIKVRRRVVTSKRAIKTSILAEHGQTIVLGGLISDNSVYSRQAVPGVGCYSRGWGVYSVPMVNLIKNVIY